MDRVEAMQKLLQVTSLPLAIVAVGRANEAPAARGFYDEERVIWL